MFVLFLLKEEFSCHSPTWELVLFLLKEEYTRKFIRLKIPGIIQ
jgi:hypothetical protein